MNLAIYIRIIRKQVKLFPTGRPTKLALFQMLSPYITVVPMTVNTHEQKSRIGYACTLSMCTYARTPANVNKSRRLSDVS